MSVALASHALSVMSALLEDVSVEATQEDQVPEEPASLEILAASTALQRAMTFLQEAPLNHLLFYLATISYRKVCHYFFFIYFKKKMIFPTMLH